MDYRERGYRARGVYLTQDTSRMETAMVKQEEDADARIIGKEWYKHRRKERGQEQQQEQHQR